MNNVKAINHKATASVAFHDVLLESLFSEQSEPPVRSLGQEPVKNRKGDQLERRALTDPRIASTQLEVKQSGSMA